VRLHHPLQQVFAIRQRDFLKKKNKILSKFNRRKNFFSSILIGDEKMKIIIEGEVDKDFPNLRNKNKDFLKQMEKAIRQRLELKDADEVVFDLKW